MKSSKEPSHMARSEIRQKHNAGTHTLRDIYIYMNHTRTETFINLKNICMNQYRAGALRKVIYTCMIKNHTETLVNIKLHV